MISQRDDMVSCILIDLDHFLLIVAINANDSNRESFVDENDEFKKSRECVRKTQQILL